MVVESIALADYERAEAELQASEGRRGFYIHAAIYTIVNIVLLVVNLVFFSQFLWFFLPLIGWGMGLTMHYLLAVRFVGRETEAWQARVERRAQELHARQVGAI